MTPHNSERTSVWCMRLAKKCVRCNTAVSVFEPFSNPNWFGWMISFRFSNSVSQDLTNSSNTIFSAQRTAIGLYSVKRDAFAVFGTGTTDAHFRDCGHVPVEIALLMLAVIGWANLCLYLCRNFSEIPSLPVAALLRKPSMIVSTLCSSTISSLILRGTA